MNREEYYKNEYCWHDLRKDPNDLPPADCEVIVHRQGKEQSELARSYCRVWLSSRYGVLKDVIAWKYLEPFKEEND